MHSKCQLQNFVIILFIGTDGMSGSLDYLIPIVTQRKKLDFSLSVTLQRHSLEDL